VIASSPTVNGRRTATTSTGTPEYRFQFEKITRELQENCPVAWSDTYGGHWGIDFVDDLANIAPAVLTMAMLGIRCGSGRFTANRCTPRCTHPNIRRTPHG